MKDERVEKNYIETLKKRVKELITSLPIIKLIFVEKKENISMLTFTKVIHLHE